VPSRAMTRFARDTRAWREPTRGPDDHGARAGRLAEWNSALQYTHHVLERTSPSTRHARPIEFVHDIS
jgi:hypothetical protein